MVRGAMKGEAKDATRRPARGTMRGGAARETMRELYGYSAKSRRLDFLPVSRAHVISEPLGTEKTLTKKKKSIFVFRQGLVNRL